MAAGRDAVDEFLRHRQETVRRVSIQRRKGDVLAHGEIHHQAGRPSILGDEEYSVANRRGWIRDLNRRSVEK